MVAAAQEEARAAGNAEVVPAHLALGLLAEPDAVAGQAITAQGVQLDTVRRTVAGALPPRRPSVPALIPYDVAAKKALELTFREALRLGHNYIGTEHILLALLEQEDGSGVLRASASPRTRPSARSWPPSPASSTPSRPRAEAGVRGQRLVERRLRRSWRSTARRTSSSMRSG